MDTVIVVHENTFVLVSEMMQNNNICNNRVLQFGQAPMNGVLFNKFSLDHLAIVSVVIPSYSCPCCSHNLSTLY